MNRYEIMAACVIASLPGLCGADVPANDNSPADHPYKTIAERNPFGLKPPPPPQPVPQPVVEQAKNDLKLTGITSFGSLKAYFMATDPKSKAPEFFSLGVEEKKDGIEVVAIDDAAKSVRIRTAGTETLMTFATHGVAPPTTPPAPIAATPGAPGVPGIAPGSVPVPGGGVNVMPVMPGVAPMSSSPSGITTIPSRTPRLQTGQSGSTAYGFSGTPVSNLPPQPMPKSTMSSEEQVIMMEIQRMANPALPPTPGLPNTTLAPGAAPPGIPVPAGPGVQRIPRLPGQ
ncbi:MAG: hypothetical protein HYY23_11650 [Verrucomicrobia bacterium]|nr:hypothetical protein [Verrucomicrobiota bacterium]